MKGRREHTDENKSANRMANLNTTNTNEDFIAFQERRKASKKERKLDLIACVIYAAFTLLAIIFVASWVEVIAHNMEPGYQYSWFNIFRMITEWR